MDVLKKADVIVGYTTYVDLIRPIVKDKDIVSTPMKKEVDRVEAAVNMALQGKLCALVSSGDAGIYAMAGLVFEMCRIRGISVFASKDAPGKNKERPGLRIEVVPGIPALCSGASLLGAPLTHDFATISLSDLLTPWETIEKRLEAAAGADFVIVLYNPKSKKRDWQLEAAQKIVLRYRDAETPVGIVSRAMREGQNIQIIPLSQLHKAPVDMQTTVFIGNSTTFTYHDFMITPRGYAEKYAMDKSKPGF
ncbi:MAG: precorrin-3B C(17)-methyltransferase [Pseudomonadota bacterium]